MSNKCIVIVTEVWQLLRTILSLEVVNCCVRDAKQIVLVLALDATLQLTPRSGLAVDCSVLPQVEVDD